MVHTEVLTKSLTGATLNWFVERAYFECGRNSYMRADLHLARKFVSVGSWRQRSKRLLADDGLSDNLRRFVSDVLGDRLLISSELNSALHNFK